MRAMPHSISLHRSHGSGHHRWRWFVLIAAAFAAVAWRTQTAISTAPKRVKSAVAGHDGAGRAGTATREQPANQAKPAPSTESAGAAPASNVPATNVPASGGVDAEPPHAAEPDTIAAGEDASGTFRPTRDVADEFGAVVTDTDPAGLAGSANWVEPAADGACPDDHPIKGNASSRIYHVPGGSSYAQTHPEFCFGSEDDARAAGFRPRAH